MKCEKSLLTLVCHAEHNFTILYDIVHEFTFADFTIKSDMHVDELLRE